METGEHDYEPKPSAAFTVAVMSHLHGNAIQRLWARDSTRVAIGAIGLAAIYFLVPVRAVELGAVWRFLGLAFILIGLGGLVVSHLHNATSRLSRLVLLLVAIVMSFALIFYVVATRNPGEFAGLETRIDALYFTLTTMTTTGYGDIVAVGQTARALVVAVFVFDLVYLALLVGAISRAVD